MENLKIIDKNNLFSNLNHFSGKKLCAMVKSDAYGHGILEIARLVEDKVEMFGVVSVEEGKKLRKITEKPILVCRHESDFRACKKYGLQVEVETKQDVLLADSLGIPMHLKIDCGMNRYGCKSLEQAFQINQILQEKDIRLCSICTHFPQNENAKETKKAVDRFLKIKSEILQNPPVCFGGSGMNFYDFDFQILRLGIGMYGYGLQGLLPVMKICSFVCKISDVEKGEYVGYGKKFRARKKMKVAIVPVGYGDGLRRNLSGKFSVEIAGKKYPAIANICMDAFFVEVDEKVKENDRVIVMQDAESFAQTIKTISYEILTGFSAFRGKTVVE